MIWYRSPIICRMAAVSADSWADTSISPVIPGARGGPTVVGASTEGGVRTPVATADAPASGLPQAEQKPDPATLGVPQWGQNICDAWRLVSGGSYRVQNDSTIAIAAATGLRSEAFDMLHL